MLRIKITQCFKIWSTLNSLIRKLMRNSIEKNKRNREKFGKSIKEDLLMSNNIKWSKFKMTYKKMESSPHYGVKIKRLLNIHKKEHHLIMTKT